MLINKNKITIDFRHSLSFPDSREDLEDWQSDILNIILDFNANNEFIIPSSGTTGDSKEIVVKKQHLLASAKKTNDFFKLKSGDHSLLLMNPKYIGGRMMIIRAIERNLKLSVLKPSNKALHFADETYDFCAMVPMQVSESIKHFPDALNKINHLIIGGGKVDSELLEKLKSYSTKTYSTFGMTETLSHVAIKELSPVYSNKFTVLKGVQISSSEDCLVIHSPEIGISNLLTKDVVEIEGNQFKWLGRKDNMINSGGVKIFPELIENKLSKHISEDFFITSKKDVKFGEILILIIESKSTFDFNFETVLDKYETPKEVYFIDSFDRTETGKIKRNQTLEKCFKN